MLFKYVPWLLWILAAWGVLKVHELQFASSCDICGPWGCGPPVQALIAIHGGWAIFLLPAAYLASLKCSSKQLQRIGFGLILVGVIGIIGVGIYQSMTWLQVTRPSLRQYFFQRWGFSILTLTDIPILQSVLFGTILLSASRVKKQAPESILMTETPEVEA